MGNKDPKEKTMNRKIILAAVSATLVAGAFGGAAVARQKGDGAMPPMARPAAYVFMLKNFDANKDGKITAEEATAGAGTLFATVDGDKDGAVTPKEMRTWQEARRTAMQDAMKGTAGGAGDAMGDPDDMGGPDQMGGPDGGQHQKHGWGKHHGKRHMMMGPSMMRSLDTDENGQISKAEAEAGAQGLVKRMDLNGDGAVSIDDFPG